MRGVVGAVVWLLVGGLSASPTMIGASPDPLHPERATVESVRLETPRLESARAVTQTPYADALADTEGVLVTWKAAYARTSPSQVLDVIHPLEQSPRAPLVVLIHGGAFMSGSRHDMAASVGAFVRRGFVVATVDYRLSGEARFPAAVNDVKAAVRYLRANADALGIDPNRIAALGESAGGYLAAMLGTTGASDVLSDASLGHAGTSSAVQAVVSRYGPTDFAAMNSQAVCEDSQDHDHPQSPESRFLGAPIQAVPHLVGQADPATHIGSGSLPPFLIEHGTRDCLVPHGQGVLLHDALRRAGGDSTLVLLEGWAHADVRFDARLPQTVHWVQSVLG